MPPPAGPQFHGSGFEYLRNDKFDARGFFAPTAPINRTNRLGCRSCLLLCVAKLSECPAGDNAQGRSSVLPGQGDTAENFGRLLMLGDKQTHATFDVSVDMSCI
jgi:hypothetical protein